AFVLAPEFARMGKQSPALDRHWRRHRLDDDAQRLGNHLAHSEAPYRLDKGQRRKRHAHSPTGCSHGADGPARLADKFLFVVGDAVLYGSGKPLPNVWRVGTRQLQYPLEKKKAGRES